MSRPVYALIDVNSFYCSCERLFRPELRRLPVVVLLNNDLSDHECWWREPVQRLHPTQAFTRAYPSCSTMPLAIHFPDVGLA